MATNDPVTRPGAGRFSYLSDADKAAIYEAALEICATIGMRVLHPEARDRKSVV